jgi:hypothetical protein
MDIEMVDPALAEGDEADNPVVVCYPDFTSGKYAGAKESAVLVGRVKDRKKRHRRFE